MSLAEELLSVFCDDFIANSSLCYEVWPQWWSARLQLLAQAGVWSVPLKKPFCHSGRTVPWSLFSGCGRGNGSSSLTDLPKSFLSLPNADYGCLLVWDGKTSDFESSDRM